MPESKRRKKKGTRSAPSRTSRPPAPLRDELPPVNGIVRAILRGSEDLVSTDDPLEAELWASTALGKTYKAPLPIGVQDGFHEAVWDGVLTEAGARRDAGSLAALRALAGVADPQLATRAAEVADRLAAGGAPDPPWAEEIGAVELVEAWRLTDPYGDQTMYFARFRYPGRPEHAITALYDENLGAIVKDAGLGGVVGDPRAKLEADRDTTVEDVEAGTFAGAVAAAIASGDMYLDNDWTQDFKDLRALLLARVRRLPQTVPPGFEPPDDAAREALVEEFLATPGAPPGDDVTRAVLDHCLTARCDFGDGDPLRWSPIVVELFLLDFLPRKAALDAGQIRALPEVLKRWVAFSLERRGLEQRWTEETQAKVDELAPEFRRAVTEPSSFGPAKAVMYGMLADGVDLEDPEAVQAWLDAFNARPFEERDAFLADSLPDLGPGEHGPRS